MLHSLLALVYFLFNYNALFRQVSYFVINAVQLFTHWTSIKYNPPVLRDVILKLYPLIISKQWFSYFYRDFSFSNISETILSISSYLTVD